MMRGAVGASDAVEMWGERRGGSHGRKGIGEDSAWSGDGAGQRRTGGGWKLGGTGEQAEVVDSDTASGAI